jgi:hypothetical protein
MELKNTRVEKMGVGETRLDLEIGDCFEVILLGDTGD